MAVHDRRTDDLPGPFTGENLGESLSLAVADGAVIFGKGRR